MIICIRRTPRRDEGSSVFEYGLLVAASAAFIVGVVFPLGSRVKSTFSQTESCISADGVGC